MPRRPNVILQSTPRQSELPGTKAGFAAATRSGLAILFPVASLASITEIPIIANTVLGNMSASIFFRVAEVGRTANPVVTRRDLARAAHALRTAFLSVAEQSVVAFRMREAPEAMIIFFIATKVVQARSRPVAATRVRITEFYTVAEIPIITETVIRKIVTGAV